MNSACRNERNVIILDNFIANFSKLVTKTTDAHACCITRIIYNGQKQSSLIVAIIECQIS